MKSELKNYMEDFVLSRLGQYLVNMDCCKCETCKLDIAAIVLNELPPKYVVTRIGEVYTKAKFLQNQFEIDLITQVAKAAKIVGAFPRHDESERV